MAGTSGVKAGKAFVIIEAVDKTAMVFKMVSTKLKRLGSNIRQMGQGMMTKGLAALTPAALSLKTFATFDDSMRKVEARSSGTAAQMQKLRDQAKELGRTTSFTASQVGELQAKLAQKGFDRSAIQNMTADVMNLARGAGSGDVESDSILAADLVGGTLRAYQKEASEASNIADVFTAAVNNSNFDLAGLVTSMAIAGPVASRFNLSLEDTVSTLAGMTNLNIDPSMAASSFKNMMLKLSDEAKRADFNKVMGELGSKPIKFVDDKGDLRRLPELLFEITSAIEHLGTAKQGQILNELFGLRAVVGAGAVGAAKDSFMELSGILESVDNTAAKTAKTMDSGLGGSFRRFMSAVEGIAIAIGEALEPSMIRLTEIINENFGEWAKWIDQNKGIIIAFFGAAAGAVLLGAGLVTLGIAISTLGTLFGVVATALVIIKGLLLLAFSPIGLAVITIGSLIALAYHLSTAFQEVVGSITDKLLMFASIITMTFGAVMDALSMGDLAMAWEVAIAGLTFAWLDLTDTLRGAWDSFITFWLTSWAGAVAQFKTMFLKAQQAIANTMLDMASKDGIMGDIMDAVLGVDVSAEKQRGIGLERQRIANLVKLQQEGIDVGDMKGNDTDKMARDGLNKDFKDKMDKVRQTAAESISQRSKDVNQIKEQRKKTLEDSRKRLNKLVSKIEKRKKAGKKTDELEKAKDKTKKKMEEGVADGGLEGPRSVIAPDIISGLEKGTVAAAQQFNKNAQESLVKKALDVAVQSKEHLANIDEGVNKGKKNGQPTLHAV